MGYILNIIGFHSSMQFAKSPYTQYMYFLFSFGEVDSELKVCISYNNRQMVTKQTGQISWPVRLPLSSCVTFEVHA